MGLIEARKLRATKCIETRAGQKYFADTKPKFRPCHDNEKEQVSACVRGEHTRGKRQLFPGARAVGLASGCDRNLEDFARHYQNEMVMKR